MSEGFETSKDVTWLKELYFSDPAHQLVIQKGDTLLTEGQFNDRLYLVLEGSLKGFLKDENHEQNEVLRSTRNMFVGVYSYFSLEHISYLTLVANEKTTLAFIDQGVKATKKFASNFLPVIVHEIYLRQKLAQLLTQQRQVAIEKLYEKEKMATLGQLAAGLAHELNNAIGVLAKNTSWLTGAISDYLSNQKLRELFLDAYRNGQPLNTMTLRKRRRKLEEKFALPTPVAKQLAKTSLDEEALEVLLKENKRELGNITLLTDAGIVLHDMDVAASHATHVVQSVRELGSGRAEQLTQTSIYETINKSLALTRSLLHDVKLNLVKETDGNMLANPGDLVQVWVNLIKNASESLKSSSTENPELTIRLIDFNDKMFEVTVQDNGPGVSDEMLSKIFQPNFTTKVNGLSFGLGLGLSIVKKIINNYKGSVLVESLPGNTRFIVQLPKP